MILACRRVPSKCRPVFVPRFDLGDGGKVPGNSCLRACLGRIKARDRRVPTTGARHGRRPSIPLLGVIIARGVASTFFRHQAKTYVTFVRRAI